MTTLGRARHREVPGHRRGPILVVLAIGLGLVAAPFAFQMFARAPGGGEMLAEFEPYMDRELLTGFQGYLDHAEGAALELEAELPVLYRDHLGLPPEAVADDHAAVATFVEEYPAIHEDMSGMLLTITDNIDNYQAVNALPPFALFPWFFLIPGVLVAALAAWWLARGRGAPGLRAGLIVLGIGLIAAPVVFQMFTRAPLGGSMIDDFEPLMTTERITEVQTHFLTMGAGEGVVRTQVLARLADEGGLSPAEVAGALPRTTAFIDVWPDMSREMAPMMGAMNDNIDNFQGVAALPPFPLFPWFFVAPGLLVAGLAWFAGRPSVPVAATASEPAAGTGVTAHP